MIRVAVIDNDKLVPAGLRALLAGTGDIVIVHTATTLSEHLAVAPESDVVLLDLRLEDGTEAAANVAKLRGHGVRVLVFSVHGDRRHVRATVRAGAGGYLVKDDDATKLADAIRSVYGGQPALTAELMSIINDDPPELSPQEARALFLYGTGSTLAATARRMAVTIPTVRSYLTRIRAKWAAIDEPVDDVRTLVDEYRPRPE
ncbi:response regulator transcription factor [Actinoplanes sp. NBRC 103695]|uniref:response regulator transcription factor n=1 Tax=Actinoplanes sp. NBRC 103695 TaxID=3032202 RepID=UPI002556B0C8|nr:response regulator transcription factor [Actinoplanes sp. NBRC 103695]